MALDIVRPTNPEDDGELTQVLDWGLMEALAIFPKAEVIYRRNRCWLLRRDKQHYMVIGPHATSMIDSAVDDVITRLTIMTKRNWLVCFESIGAVLVAHLRAGSRTHFR